MKGFFRAFSSAWRRARTVYYRFQHERLTARIKWKSDQVWQLRREVESLAGGRYVDWSEIRTISSLVKQATFSRGPLGQWAARYTLLKCWTDKYDIYHWHHVLKAPYTHEEVTDAFEEARKAQLPLLADEIRRREAEISRLQEEAKPLAQKIRELEDESEQALIPQLPKVRIEPPAESKRDKLARLRLEADALEEEILAEEQVISPGPLRRASGVPASPDDS